MEGYRSSSFENDCPTPRHSSRRRHSLADPSGLQEFRAKHPVTSLPVKRVTNADNSPKASRARRNSLLTPRGGGESDNYGPSRSLYKEDSLSVEDLSSSLRDCDVSPRANGTRSKYQTDKWSKSGDIEELNLSGYPENEGAPRQRTPRCASRKRVAFADEEEEEEEDDLPISQSRSTKRAQSLPQVPQVQFTDVRKTTNRNSIIAQYNGVASPRNHTSSDKTHSRGVSYKSPRRPASTKTSDDGELLIRRNHGKSILKPPSPKPVSLSASCSREFTMVLEGILDDDES